MIQLHFFGMWFMWMGKQMQTKYSLSPCQRIRGDRLADTLHMAKRMSLTI